MLEYVAPSSLQSMRLRHHTAFIRDFYFTRFRRFEVFEGFFKDTTTFHGEEGGGEGGVFTVLGLFWPTLSKTRHEFRTIEVFLAAGEGVTLGPGRGETVTLKSDITILLSGLLHRNRSK